MGEKIIKIDSVNPVEFFGVNESNIEHLRKHFPKLKIIARGNSVKAIGDDDELRQFEIKLHLFIESYTKYGKLSDADTERILESTSLHVGDVSKEQTDTLVFGNSGVVIKARTPNQRKMVEGISKNDMLFAIGPAGTGKTYTAVALAVRALKNKEVKKIILTRPAVEAGENIGFLPGDMKEKLDPYLQPLYDALFDMVPPEKLESYIENRIVEIAPLGFMRGRTLDNAFVILDEGQNATESQMKMFLTRMGSSAKFIVTGDVTQIDLPKQQPSGLIQAAKILKGIPGIDIIYLDQSDVIRHKLVKDIISKYETQNSEKK